MITITFTNQKGGVAKTTTSTHFAHYLAKQGYKVAFLDADGQANGTWFLKPYVSKLVSSKHFITQLFDNIEDSNLVCIGADKSVFGIKDIIPNLLLKNKSKLEQLGFDYLIIDTAPSKSDAQIASIIISDGVFIPLHIGKLSLDGVKNVIFDIVKINKEYKLDVKVLGLIPSHLIGTSDINKLNLGKLITAYPNKTMPCLFNRQPYVTVMNGDDKTMDGHTPIWDIRPCAGNIKTASKEMLGLMESLENNVNEEMTTGETANV